MNTAELTIGDLVYFGSDEYSPSKIEGILPYDEGIVLDFDNEPVANDNIRPIPLTEEILMGNGWEKNKFSSAYINHGVPFRLDIGICCLWLDHEWDDYYNAFSFQYVHELQHALRLCGLQELADNFIL